jgi:hypothetical protein
VVELMLENARQPAFGFDGHRLPAGFAFSLPLPMASTLPQNPG